MNVHAVAVGIDIGTTAAKALACATDGRIIAETAERYGSRHLAPDFMEQVVDAVLPLWHPEMHHEVAGGRAL